MKGCVAWKPLHIRYGYPHKPSRKNSVKGLPCYAEPARAGEMPDQVGHDE